jgi:hypothetical protein
MAENILSQGHSGPGHGGGSVGATCSPLEVVDTTVGDKPVVVGLAVLTVDSTILVDPTVVVVPLVVVVGILVVVPI